MIIKIIKVIYTALIKTSSDTVLYKADIKRTKDRIHYQIGLHTHFHIYSLVYNYKQSISEDYKKA